MQSEDSTKKRRRDEMDGTARSCLNRHYESTDKAFLSFLASLAQIQNAVSKEWEHFKATREQIREERSEAQDVVLDVGGQKFQTNCATLLQHDDHDENFFCSLVSSGKWNPEADPELTIDRDPKAFHHILNYLKTNQQVALSSIVGEAEQATLLSDIQFYHVNPLLLTTPTTTNTTAPANAHAENTLASKNSTAADSQQGGALPLDDGSTLAYCWKWKDTPAPGITTHTSGRSSTITCETYHPYLCNAFFLAVPSSTPHNKKICWTVSVALAGTGHWPQVYVGLSDSARPADDNTLCVDMRDGTLYDHAGPGDDGEPLFWPTATPAPLRTLKFELDCSQSPCVVVIGDDCSTVSRVMKKTNSPVPSMQFISGCQGTLVTMETCNSVL
eukprot:TRINITY_DN95440_c0_g1_i1.p1 TRINITY_DN95440_c0_g1~~TRINITY_DN95440_c0_g1_i1.p1  ORF type:complete len:387 (+),score=42.01 TRINITY_DN95440_c0_g1_i1:30-1190(+)